MVVKEQYLRENRNAGRRRTKVGKFFENNWGIRETVREEVKFVDGKTDVWSNWKSQLVGLSLGGKVTMQELSKCIRTFNEKSCSFQKSGTLDDIKKSAYTSQKAGIE
jgi:hypothetical protein